MIKSLAVKSNLNPHKTVKFIANWKMNGSFALVEDYIQGLNRQELKGKQVIIAPSMPFLTAFGKLSNPSVSLAAQDISSLGAASGAYTGEVSAKMAKECGAGYVLIGHSERRQYNGDSEQVLKQKLSNALLGGLVPIFCIGESLAEYHRGETKQALTRQLAVLEGLEMPEIIIAYEPVWAIGSNQTPTAQELAEVFNFVIACCQESDYLKSSNFAVVYGGSVGPENAGQILAVEGCSGLLVGGASLSFASFQAIINSI